MLAAAGCRDDGSSTHRYAGETMGSTFEVKFTGDTALAQVKVAVDKELAAADTAFSRWREDSEIARLNRNGKVGPFGVSDRFAAVLRDALRVARHTEGAFDPTVGPLLEIYRTARDDPEHRLDLDALALAQERVGHDHVAVREGKVIRDLAGLEFDLDGIVAGACIDSIAARLDALGVPGYYIEVTGEVYCRGEKAAGVPWQIGVVDPRADVTGGNVALTTLSLRDKALCTSGDYRNAFAAAGGRVVHHVFDPRTGRNAEHDVVSVAVMHDSAAIADALGTAFLVLGVDGTRAVLPELGDFGELGVLLLVADEQQGLRQVAIGWPEEKR